jgi:hypothetical protein
MSQIGNRPPVPYAEARAKAPRPKPTPVVKVNRERGGHRAPENVNEPLRAWIRQQPCLLTGLDNVDGVRHTCLGPIQCCHVKPWGSSLTDESNVIPLCGKAHAQQEGKTRQFESTWPVRLAMAARKYSAKFYRESGERAAKQAKA